MGAAMAEYRMHIYEAGEKLWQTHQIYAQNDTEAKAKAQERYDELAKERREQKLPALDTFSVMMIAPFMKSVRGLVKLEPPRSTPVTRE
jgi:hypothetical protein